MTVHQYSCKKTIATFIITAIVMGVILFLGLLFFSLIQQLVTFEGPSIKKLCIGFRREVKNDPETKNNQHFMCFATFRQDDSYVLRICGGFQ